MHYLSSNTLTIIMLTLLQFILVEQLFVIAPILLRHSVEYQIKIVE
jgi:hypothetical protein